MLSFLIGAPIGYLLARKRFPGRSLLEGTILLPLVLPPTVLGYYLLVTFGKTGRLAELFQRLTNHEMPQIAFTWQGATLAACLVSVPLLIRSVQTAFSEIESDLIDSARVQGANEWQVFRFLILPLSLRSVISGIGLSFARALGDFGATLMIGGSIPGETRTLPLAVYDAVNSGEDRLALVYVLILSGVCLIFSILASQLTPRYER